MTFRKLMAGAVMAGVAFCGLAATSNAGEYDGITLNLLTRPGPVIAGRLAERDTVQTQRRLPVMPSSPHD